MTPEVSPEHALDRRFLLRGGAVLAGVAGATVVGAALAPTAEAADGQFMVVGQPNSATSSTVITENGSAPTLRLVNTTGPSLKLDALDFDWDGALGLGEVANTEGGPRIGVDYGDGVETTYLATGIDLAEQPAPIAITPERYLDSRVKADRESVLGASSSAPFDSKGQLKAGQWIDIGIAPLGVGSLSAVFLNLTAVKPTSSGYLAAYPSGFPLPNTSNVNFQTNVTVANAAFIAVGEAEGFYAIRVYVAKASHIIVDLTGVVLGGPSASADVQAAQSGRRGQQVRRLAKMRRAVGSNRR